MSSSILSALGGLKEMTNLNVHRTILTCYQEQINKLNQNHFIHVDNLHSSIRTMKELCRERKKIRKALTSVPKAKCVSNVFFSD